MSEEAPSRRIPLPGLLDPLLARIRRGVVEAAHEAGFTDTREAHNPVFAFVPPEGIRLTELAARAGMSKQAMGELVDDLVDKQYFTKEPDPTDGRAKLITWSDRALLLDETAQAYFDRLENQLADLVGADAMRQLRTTLQVLVTSGLVAAPESGPPR
jgi:DNA-binding MarR family transcriptional regulator